MNSAAGTPTSENTCPIEGVEPGSLDLLGNWTLEADQVLVF